MHAYIIDTSERECFAIQRGDHVTTHTFIQGRSPHRLSPGESIRPHPFNLQGETTSTTTSFLAFHSFSALKLFPIILKSVKMSCNDQIHFYTKINFGGLFFCQDKSSWCDEGSANVHLPMRNLGQPSSPPKNDNSSAVMNQTSFKEIKRL